MQPEIWIGVVAIEHDLPNGYFSTVGDGLSGVLPQ